METRIPTFISICVSGGTDNKLNPYHFEWNLDNRDGVSVSNAEYNLNSISAGQYSVRITDLNGCSPDTAFESVYHHRT